MPAGRYYVLLSRKGVSVYRQTRKDIIDHVAEDCGHPAFICCDVLETDVSICTIQNYLDKKVPTPLFTLGSHTVNQSHFDIDQWDTTARVAVWFFGPGKGWLSEEAASHAAKIELVRAEIVYSQA